MPDPLFALLDETSQPIELLLSVARDTAPGRSAPRSRNAPWPRSATAPCAPAPRPFDARPGAPARRLPPHRRRRVRPARRRGLPHAAPGRAPARGGRAAALAEPTGRGAPSTARRALDFRPSVPDVSTFPRSAWLRSLKRGGDDDARRRSRLRRPNGVEALRAALADYLGRVRGVSGGPAHVSSPAATRRGSGSSATRSPRPARSGSRSRTRATPRPRDRSTRAGLERCRSPSTSTGSASTRSREPARRRASSSPPPTSIRPASC